LLEVMELLSPQSQKMGINVDFSFGKGCVCMSDRRMLKQVCINLLANAIKFSNYHDVSVWIEVHDGCAHVHFKDKGIGMDASWVEALFTPFVRLSNAKEVKGTGLGLALAQSYMQKLGGEIVAKSEGIHKGSEFIIMLKECRCGF